MSAPRSYRVRVRPASPLAVGGWSHDAVADSKSAAREGPRGESFWITGSALRGALRTALEQVLRGAGVAACPPARDGAPGDDCACRVCALFGNVGREGLVQVGFASEVDADRGRLVPLLRDGVAVDRHTGSAVPGRLFQQRVAAPLGAVELVSELTFARAPTDAELDDLALAARLVTRVGGGAARGLGHVRCELVAAEASASPVEPASAAAGAASAGAVLWLEPESPFHVGSERNRLHYLRSLGHVPGSAVRGAVCASLAERSQESPAGFEQLATAAGFGDAVPALEGRPAVRPRSTHECRTCGRLATHVLAERLAAAAASVAPAIAFSQHGRCSKCGGKLRPVEPFAALPRRLWTRVALDRHTASAAEGQLHTLEVIDPDGLSGGLRLRCEVRGAGPEAAALLHGLHGQRVAIGHGRGVGLGRMRVCVEPLPRTPDIAARVVRLHDAVRHVAGTSASVEAQWAALMLTGPWTRACGGEHPLWADSDAELVAAFPLRGVVAGFDLQANAERAPRHAWLPGSVFAYRFAAERPAAWWRDLQAQGLAGVGPGAVRGEGRFELNPDLCLEEARP